MARTLVALLSGLLFGLGLVISRMIDPAKVLGFLDLAGRWDASLAFVMAAAVVVAGAGFRMARGRAAPLLDERFRSPERSALDRPLIGGALLFGVGWGLAGFCPGPALTALALGRLEPFVFVAAMLAGMALYGGFEALVAAHRRRCRDASRRPGRASGTARPRGGQ